MSETIRTFVQTGIPTARTRLKIAVWHNLPSGGGKRALYQHVKGLVDRGHDLECWTLSTGDRSYLPIGELITEHVIPYEPSAKPGILGRVSDAYSVYRKAMTQIREVDDISRSIAADIESREFDLLFANSGGPFFMPYILRHVRSLPKVLYLQEPNRPLYEADPILPWIRTITGNSNGAVLKKWRTKVHDSLRFKMLNRHAQYEWLNANSCDELLVNSYFSRESLARAYGVNAKVCYLGIDTEKFRPLDLKRENFVVSVGALHPTKGVDLGIEAVARLAVPRPALVWISNFGDEGYMAEMQQLAARRAVELSVKSMATDAELVDLLNRAAAFVYTPRLEPFGFAPLEAAACGTPVVAVAEGGVRETVRDGIDGFLVERDAQQISAALAKLLREPE